MYETGDSGDIKIKYDLTGMAIFKDIRKYHDLRSQDVTAACLKAPNLEGECQPTVEASLRIDFCNTKNQHE